MEKPNNLQSRVMLSGFGKDEFGLARAEVNIGFTAADLKSIVTSHQLFVDNFSAKGLGDVTHSAEGLERYLKGRVSGFNSADHHLGTTRMSDDPKRGVVDRNAKVYGLDNLYVSGSSIFPTGGHANPTLTIVAHALMLADHLSR